MHIKDKQRILNANLNENQSSENQKKVPSWSRMVAQRLFARGQELRLQIPVTLYGFRQKFPVVILIKQPIKSESEHIRKFRSQSMNELNNNRKRVGSEGAKATYLVMKLQCLCLITCHITSSFCIANSFDSTKSYWYEFQVEKGDWRFSVQETQLGFMSPKRRED